MEQYHAGGASTRGRGINVVSMTRTRPHQSSRKRRCAATGSLCCQRWSIGPCRGSSRSVQWFRCVISLLMCNTTPRFHLTFTDHAVPAFNSFNTFNSFNSDIREDFPVPLALSLFSGLGHNALGILHMIRYLPPRLRVLATKIIRSVDVVARPTLGNGSVNVGGITEDDPTDLCESFADCPVKSTPDCSHWECHSRS